MTVFILKYFSVAVVSAFFYLKILNIKKAPPAKVILTGVLVILLTFLTYETRTIATYFYIALAVTFISVFFKFILKERWGLAVTVAFISYSMSYALFIISVFIIELLLATAFRIDVDQPTLIFFILFFAVHLVLAILLFKIKRLKNGFPFLRIEGVSNFAILFSFFILLFVSVSSPTFDLRQLVVLSLLGAIVCAGGMFFWWRSSITRAYKDTLKDKQIDEANKKAVLQEQELETLKERNKFLASVIHRDNKLIPAMSLAVKNFIQLSGSRLDEETKGKAQTIIDEMTTQTNERAGILSEYKTEADTIPKTNIFKLDAVFEHLQAKAIQRGVIFDLSVLCDVKYLINEVITEANFVTAIADLLDNAIYSVLTSPFKRVMTTICIEDGCYEVRVCDSGADFNVDTLHNLGIVSATTHENDGGSGIGYLTIFKILSEINASLVIYEYEHKPNALTKQITIRFDGKNQYIVDSPRASQADIDNNRKTALS